MITYWLILLRIEYLDTCISGLLLFYTIESKQSELKMSCLATLMLLRNCNNVSFITIPIEFTKFEPEFSLLSTSISKITILSFVVMQRVAQVCQQQLNYLFISIIAGSEGVQYWSHSS